MNTETAIWLRQLAHLTSTLTGPTRQMSAQYSADSTMADQLAGQWWADATGLGSVAPEAHVRRALRVVFEHNVRGFGDGRAPVPGEPCGATRDSRQDRKE